LNYYLPKINQKLPYFNSITSNFSINCNGNLIDLSSPKVMGIVNVTPDSFFKGSRSVEKVDILAKVEKMLSEGATFIDIGGHSTRPHASAVPEAEEMARVIPAIEMILREFPECLISIDTFRSNVAKKAVEAGAVIINDVSGGLMDVEMYQTVVDLSVPYVLMHMRGTIDTMTQYADYENIGYEVLDEIEKKVGTLRKLGQKDIIIDLGFGFSKTADQNFQLLNKLETFKMLECPILVGISRKSMIWKKLDISADNALNGTTVLNTVALQKGANILRVHDVKEAMETIKLIELLNY
jgi:dihydropteroate synthase